MEYFILFKINDWFDCLNVRVPQTDSRERMKAFGLALDVQMKIIEDMTTLMSNMRVHGKNSRMPFQTGKNSRFIKICNNFLFLYFRSPNNQ